MLLATKLVFHFRTTPCDGELILGFLHALQSGMTSSNSSQQFAAETVLRQIGGQLRVETVRSLYFLMILLEKDSVSTRFGLFELYQSTTFLESFDPRDQLYGLLGVVRDIRPSDVMIDYKQEPLEVLAQIPSLLIQTYDNLNFLCYPEGSPSAFLSDKKKATFQGSPTWLPLPGNTRPFPHCNIASHQGEASGSMAASVNIDQHHGISLRCKGLRIDSVASKGQHMDILYAPITEWFQDLRRIAVGSVDANDSGFWNDTLKSYTDGRRYGRERNLRSYYDFLSLVAQRVAGLGMDNLTMHALLRKPVITKTLTAEEFHIARELFKMFSKRRLFSAHRFGTGLVRSCDLQVGDEIWVILGCPLPLILRKWEPSGYVLVSQYWVEGSMASNGTQGSEADGRPGTPFLDPQWKT